MIVTMKYIINIILCVLGLSLCISCIEDRSRYDYRTANEVSWLSLQEGYSFTSGETVEITAPLEFSEPFEDEADIDEAFEISWYLDGELFATGYRISYAFGKSGGFSLVLKVVNRATGETYISDKYVLESKSSFGWGWLVLSERESGASSLSVISPLNMNAAYRLEDIIDGGLGTRPKGLDYYYVMGTIPGSYVSGLPKIIVNQSSGTVTLDGTTLQKDQWMRDEFESGNEPEDDFTMAGFAWKSSYYLIYTAERNVYMRCMEKSNSSIPYYGTYSSMPYSFDGGAEITCFQGFQNVTYWTADEDVTMMYDSLNSRFLAFVSGGYGSSFDAYSPKVVYFGYYDSEASFDASVRKVNDMGHGTRCLAIGAYEKVATDPSGYGVDFYPSYVALIDLMGTGEHYVYCFTVNPMGSNNHVITENTQIPFSGSGLLTAESVIRMSSNFEKYPYFFFTDGDRNLYVYSMAAGGHALAYTAPSRITHICPSPLVCEFSKYGGNSTEPNFRLALGLEDGDVEILDVQDSKMVRLFEGFAQSLHLKSLSGFGDIRDIVWATNYEGEY